MHFRNGQERCSQLFSSRIFSYEIDGQAYEGYYVSPAVPPDGGSYSNHPVVGVSWYGAVKYCNWLTIDTGRTPAQRCYREGTNTLDWAPVTCSATNWARGVFSDRERADWLKLKGFRLPMDNCSRPTSWINTFFRVSNAEFAAFLNEVE